MKHYSNFHNGSDSSRKLGMMEVADAELKLGMMEVADVELNEVPSLTLIEGMVVSDFFLAK